MSNFKVLNSLVCDEVRREMTGKDIIIGAYGSGITVPNFPILVALAMWCQILPLKAGQLILEIMWKVADQKPIMGRLSATINVPEDPFAMFAPSVPLEIHAEGNIEIYFRELGEEDWILVQRKVVQLARRLDGHTSSQT